MSYRELQGTVGGELEPAAIPQQLFSSQLFQGGTSPQTEIVFAARRTHDGNVSLFTSAKFEKEVQPRSVIEIQCNSKKPILDLIFPPDEIGKVMATFPDASLESKLTQPDFVFRSLAR